MTENIENITTDTSATTQKNKFQRVVEGMLRVLGIDEFVTYVQVLKNFFVVLTIVCIGIIEIFNTHLAERMTRRINNKKQEIKELRWEYMSVNAEKNEKTKQSEIQKLVLPLGLNPLQEPPKKIEIEK
ncbi:MAG: hypothetical protein IPK18_07935 [Sphingobacteriales bacterium]|jgi:signal transduction histidine kinase|nr:MAG: hypothetical protein IPK18_07935 [Sphingobacteriales bacterium]